MLLLKNLRKKEGNCNFVLKYNYSNNKWTNINSKLRSAYNYTKYLLKGFEKYMLELRWQELFLRNIPEMLLFMYGIIVISGHVFHKKKYLMASLGMSLLTFFVRTLPIDFGVHTLINNAITVVVAVIISIPVKKAVYSTLLMTVLLALCEFLNMILLIIFKVDFQAVTSPAMKAIYGIPSLIILGVILFVVQTLIKKRKEKLSAVN
jgi:hypothetical protein